jgi:AcrR family transcriptional regulator
MLAFWRGGGYETTSVSDLTEALGITPPSLYTAFGDKKQLFLEAIKLYAGPPEQTGRPIAESPNAYAAAQMLLTRAAALFTGEETPRGCLLVNSTMGGSDDAADVRAEVVSIRENMKISLRARIERDIAEGVMPKDADSEVLSDTVIATIQGMAVLARDGMSRERLNALGRQAIAAWPQPVHPR